MQNSKEESISKDENNSDLSFSYLHGWLNKTPQFMMYVYKIKACKRTLCDFPYGPCPFLHDGEVGRRDLLWHSYSCVPCVDFKAGFCPRGISCACAHGILEQRFHPMLLRTRFCWYMTACKRKDCSYAHKEEEKRVPTIAPHVACPRSYSTTVCDIFTNTSSALNPIVSPGKQTFSINNPDRLPTFEILIEDRNLNNISGVKRNTMNLHSE